MKRIFKALEHAVHLLPTQGPITVFIHHNTLHAFERQPFDVAVREGARIFGCEPYRRESDYRAELRRGRIRLPDLRSVLLQELGGSAESPVPPRGTRYELRLALLEYPVQTASRSELLWYIEENGALYRFRDDVPAPHRLHLISETRHWMMRDLRPRPGSREKQPWLEPVLARFDDRRIEEWDEARWEAFTLHLLWQVCQRGVKDLPATSDTLTAQPVRYRDMLWELCNVDTDLPVHDLLIPFCAVYLDQGLASQTLPERERGIFQAFCRLYSRGPTLPIGWRRELARLCDRWLRSHISPEEAILESLQELAIPPEVWEEYLTATLLALRGWAGMLHMADRYPDRFARPLPPNNIAGYTAARLGVERLVVREVICQHWRRDAPCNELWHQWRQRQPMIRRSDPAVRAFVVFQLAPLLGWTPQELHELNQMQWQTLIQEIEAFPEPERRRIFHQAYERHFYNRALDALAVHAPRPLRQRPRLQVITCIDEREESFRRHLEEVIPAAETFGTAGFFALPMYYRGASDAHFVPLCPVTIRPQHWVEERVTAEEQHQYKRWQWWRRNWGQWSHRLHRGSRTASGGAVLTTGLGILAVVPLVARVLFPSLTARLRHTTSRWMLAPPQRTYLTLERLKDPAGPREDHLGFSVQEMQGIAERLLRDIGLTQRFARLVLIIGHGSHSMNNPHESAHDCGACGGSHGGPNARAAAQILNDPRVRRYLESVGIRIPPDTVFVGAFHDTCDDHIKYFDLHRLPASHQPEFERLQEQLHEVLCRNAHERCRRFASAPLNMAPEEALAHVTDRAEDLAQVRPEYGHATNALCIVGRRERTRGLFLDRRAFLVSYDPEQDDAHGTILARCLQPIWPVCGGINLEYYFSYVDNSGYGCGTKLPHNITSLLGVMDGAASDLRTGLPWQMVEIHEPVRLLLVVETTPPILQQILEQNSALQAAVRQQWIHLAVLDPNSSQLYCYHQGQFVSYTPTTWQLPVAADSTAWYRGWRDHLSFASIALPQP